MKLNDANDLRNPVSDVIESMIDTTRASQKVNFHFITEGNDFTMNMSVQEALKLALMLKRAAEAAHTFQSYEQTW